MNVVNSEEVVVAVVMAAVEAAEHLAEAAEAAAVESVAIAVVVASYIDHVVAAGKVAVSNRIQSLYWVSMLSLTSSYLLRSSSSDFHFRCPNLPADSCLRSAGSHNC